MESPLLLSFKAPSNEFIWRLLGSTFHESKSVDFSVYCFTLQLY